MNRLVKPLLSAALLVIGAGAGQSFADEREVNNIWWELDDGYNGSNQTACVAENYNDHAVDAVFDVFPAAYDYDGGPMPRQIVVTLNPFETTKLYSWANGAGPGPRCELLSYSLHVS